MNSDIENLRFTYDVGELDVQSIGDDPIVAFRAWMESAFEAEISEPNAMAIATVGADGQPSLRTVLLRKVDDQGFVFFTNYLSRKGRDIEANPRVALMFYWPPIHRQVIVRGVTRRIPADDSAAYFRSRPRGSQLAAWTSKQSQDLGARSELEARLEAIAARFEGVDVEVPDFWGGFVVEPFEIEFWQGRPDRLHDRLIYRKRSGRWDKSLLWP